MRNNDLQRTTQKTKTVATRSQLKSGMKLGMHRRINSSYSTSSMRRVTFIAKMW